MATRIEFRRYPSVPAVVAVATGTDSRGRCTFASSGNGTDDASAVADLLAWSRACRRGAGRAAP